VSDFSDRIAVHLTNMLSADPQGSIGSMTRAIVAMLALSREEVDDATADLICRRLATALELPHLVVVNSEGDPA
jgi:hypothetical protein